MIFIWTCSVWCIRKNYSENWRSTKSRASSNPRKYRKSSTNSPKRTINETAWIRNVHYKKTKRKLISRTQHQNGIKEKSSGSETLVYQREKADEDQELTLWDRITKSCWNWENKQLKMLTKIKATKSTDGTLTGSIQPTVSALVKKYQNVPPK